MKDESVTLKGKKARWSRNRLNSEPCILEVIVCTTARNSREVKKVIDSGCRYMLVNEMSNKANHDLVLRFLWDLIRVAEFWDAGRRGRGKFLNSSPGSILSRTESISCKGCPVCG